MQDLNNAPENSAESSQRQVKSPSCKQRMKGKASLGFNATQQHVRNVNLVIQCEECSMWRLLFSKKKLDLNSRMQLTQVIEDISYTCGATFSELDLPDNLKQVCVKHHECYNPIEKLYYSTGFEPICIHCGGALDDVNCMDGLHPAYPQCLHCSHKTPILKPRKHSDRKQADGK